LRIVVLSESKGFGGAEQYVLSLAGGLAGLGHEVHILAPSGARWPLRDDGDWATRFMPSTLDAFRPAQALWLARVIRRLRPDVLHINMPSAYSAGFGMAAPVGRALGCGVVTTEHLSMIGRSRRRAFLKSLFAPYVRKVIAVCDATATALKEIHGVAGDKITVVYNGVDPEALSFVERSRARSVLEIPEGVPAIGCLGELIPRKGQSYLIEAASGLSGGPAAGAAVVIIGDGEDRDRLRSLIAERGLEKTVRLAGNVERAGSLLKAFDVFVMPSLMEAFPFALLEAMAAGVPVAASSVWGIPEMVVHENTGLLFPPGDVEAIREAIVKLVGDPDLRERMGRGAQKAVAEKFSLDRMVRGTAAVYETLA
jgi:glycosyltransferase involved in cell wall biosynthesis